MCNCNKGSTNAPQVVRNFGVQPSGNFNAAAPHFNASRPPPTRPPMVNPQGQPILPRAPRTMPTNMMHLINRRR